MLSLRSVAIAFFLHGLTAAAVEGCGGKLADEAVATRTIGTRRAQDSPSPHDDPDDGPPLVAIDTSADATTSIAARADAAADGAR